MIPRFLLVSAALLFGRTAVPSDVAPAGPDASAAKAAVIDTNCYDFSKGSSSGSVWFSISNDAGSSVEVTYQCDYWGDATDCSMDRTTETLAGFGSTSNTVYWDMANGAMTSGGGEDSGIEFFANSSKIHVNDLGGGAWWNPGYAGGACVS